MSRPRTECPLKHAALHDHLSDCCRFKHVFFVAGNHELWWRAVAGAPERSGLPGPCTHSIGKLLRLYEMAEALGAHAAPALLGGDPSKGEEGVAIIGLQSWCAARLASDWHLIGI